MKKIIPFVLLAMLLPSFANAQKKQMMFGVAFYNLENLFDTIPNNPYGRDLEYTPGGDNHWDSRKYLSKIKNMSYAISQLKTDYTPEGPAVIGCSEVENLGVLQDLVAADAIKDWNLQIIHHDSPDRRGIDVSLLYNPKFFKPIHVTNHYLDIGYPTRDQMCVVGLLGGCRTAIIVNHWPSRRGGEVASSPGREKAAALTRHICDSLYQIDPNMGVVIMGDLNDDPYNKSVAEVIGAVKNISDCHEGGYFNPFWKKYDDGIGSYIYRGGWDLFDQIIVNYNLVKGLNGLTYKNCKVWNDIPALIQQEGQYKGYPLRTFSAGKWTNGYSDHLPTEIFLVRDL
ncbi:MAG: endonuclease/exonuclease/phosphatase family protein [Muribaculaceae bacterium]|nr:endonuclease/exonuclease/phosphatase family protein [Muribaculaceae bacterium]